MSEALIPCVIESIGTNEEAGAHVIFLKEIVGERPLPMFVAEHYAHWISEALTESLDVLPSYFPLVDRLFRQFGLVPLYAIVGDNPSEDEPFDGWMDIRHRWLVFSRTQRVRMLPADALLIAVLYKVGIQVQQATMDADGLDHEALLESIGDSKPRE